MSAGAVRGLVLIVAVALCVVVGETRAQSPATVLRAKLLRSVVPHLVDLTVGAESRAAEARGATSDVPEGSTEPLLDGLTAVVRDWYLRGFDPSEKGPLTDRILAILRADGAGDEAGRRRRAELTALTLIGLDRNHSAIDADGVARVATADDERAFRIMAEALARHLYRWLSADRSVVASRWARMARSLNPPPGYVVADWRTLAGFEYTEGMKLPAEVLALHGKKVAIAGYMYTLDEVENIRRFLVLDSPLPTCGFESPNWPSLVQIFEVQIIDQGGVPYLSRPIMVLGTFDVGEKSEDGFVTSVYRLKVDGPQDVKPVE